MKVPISLRGAAGTLRALKKAGTGKVVLHAGPGLAGSPEGLSLLREAADICIARGDALEIPGVPPCRLPGYASYLRGAAGTALRCPRAGACFLSGSCAGIPAEYRGRIDMFVPPSRNFTDLERCMLAVLSRRSPLSTPQVLRAAKGIKICASCSNSGEVFRAAERLIKLGLVSRKFKGGTYIWEKI